MASLTTPLLGAGAQAKNDWAHASAETSLTFKGEAEFRRGYEVEIGLGALASADAGLSRFIDATVRGNAFAEAKASLQSQLPLNLFDEFGLAVGAQAVAQAAAGIEVGLGLRIGDFIALIEENPESHGLPLDLVKLLLDEAVVGGKFEVHAAASAMAYASLKITGEVVRNPGFQIFADAGLGLAAGVGFSGGLELGIHDFRRFYGRAVDRTLEHTVQQLTLLASDNALDLKPVLHALVPVASMALRVAYELGVYVVRNAPAPDPEATADLSNHCVGIVLEEAQRFLFARFLEVGLRSVEQLVNRDVPNLAAGEWDRVRPERLALAATLRRMPAEPFQPTDVNAAYWVELIAGTLTLVSRLPVSVGPDMIRGASLVYAATTLLTEAVKSRVNQAEAYAFAIGAGRATTPRPSFNQPLTGLLDPRIRDHIKQELNRSQSHVLDQADLIAYLVTDGVIQTLRDTLPEIDTYLAIFQHPNIAGNLADAARALLQHRDAFIRNGAGDLDPQETLRILLNVLDTFITIKIVDDLVPAINQHVADDNAKLYFNEVLVGTLLFTKTVTFDTVLHWATRPVDQKAFTEALAGVLTMLVGRSLVLVGDGFRTALQRDMQRACAHAAAQIDSANDPFAAMGIARSPELKALIADTLRIGGEVFGPLPEETRRRLRFVLYDVMETLPPTAAAQTDLLHNLADQFFIPNEEALGELAEELLEISRDRFQLLVVRVLEAAGQLILAAIEDFIRDTIEAVTKWAQDVEDAIKVLVDRLAKLDEEIRELMTRVELAFTAALDDVQTFLDSFSAQSLRTKLRNEIRRKFYKKAKDVLTDNDFYRGLPSDVRRFIRGKLEDAVHDLVETPVLDPIFEAVGSLADDLGDVLEDVRELNPEEPLGPQLLELVIDRMEDRIEDAFGGSKPRIDVGFRVTVFGQSHRFSLGTVKLPFDKVFSALRDAIEASSFYGNELETAAASLANAFAEAIGLAAKEAERTQGRATRERLERIRAEYTTEPKTITIVSPAQSAVHDDAVEIQIHLGAVPASYLGLKQDEQQRVLVFLNGDLLPNDSFETTSTMPPAATLNAPHLNVRAIDAGANVPAKLSVMPPLAGAIRAIGAQRKGPSSRPAGKQQFSISSSGKGITTASVVNVRPGQRLTATKRKSLEDTLPAGTTLRMRIDRGRSLAAGTNTLVVVVLDPGGQRYQHSVGFCVTAPSRDRRPGARLPSAPNRRPSRDPAARRNELDVHFDPDALALKARRNQDAMKQHVAGHLTGFPRR